MPSLNDDGQTVTLDLHGATVGEAVALARAAVREAARRGRTRIKLIHGSSTSSTRYRNRTIKYALYDLIEGGQLGGVTSTWRAEGSLTCSLDVTAPREGPSPIRLQDIW